MNAHQADGAYYRTPFDRWLWEDGGVFWISCGFMTAILLLFTAVLIEDLVMKLLGNTKKKGKRSHEKQ